MSNTSRASYRGASSSQRTSHVFPVRSSPSSPAATSSNGPRTEPDSGPQSATKHSPVFLTVMTLFRELLEKLPPGTFVSNANHAAAWYKLQAQNKAEEQLLLGEQRGSRPSSRKSEASNNALDTIGKLSGKEARELRLFDIGITDTAHGMLALPECVLPEGLLQRETETEVTVSRKRRRGPSYLEDSELDDVM